MNLSKKLQSLRIRWVKTIAERFRNSSFFLQGHMDIDPRSPWFDPSFNQAYGGFFLPRAAKSRTLTALPMHDHVRRDMLALLCRSIEERNVEGAIAELGVYQGSTARLLHHYFPDRPLHLFDTFEGFDQKDVGTEKHLTGLSVETSHFADTAVDQVKKTIAPKSNNVHFFQGYFPDSVPAEIKETRYALVHLDADLYAPTKAGLDHFFALLNPGGFIVVHDYNAWPGARKAVEEFCSEARVFPIPMPDKSGSCLIIKPPAHDS